MRIIPVIDLLDGTVVHAVAGKRKEYKPIESELIDSADPIDLAVEFDKMGFKELYIADLNAITSGSKTNKKIVKKISKETNLEIILDAGFETSEKIEHYTDIDIERIVMATETLTNFREVRKASEEYPFPVTGSVDTKGEKIVAKSLEDELSLNKVLKSFENNDAAELILLNLKRVGTRSGPDGRTLKRASEVVDLPILLGGGVRNVADLKKAEEASADGALVATALHNGSIKPKEISISKPANS